MRPNWQRSTLTFDPLTKLMLWLTFFSYLFRFFFFAFVGCPSNLRGFFFRPSQRPSEKKLKRAFICFVSRQHCLFHLISSAYLPHGLPITKTTENRPQSIHHVHAHAHAHTTITNPCPHTAVNHANPLNQVEIENYLSENYNQTNRVENSTLRTSLVVSVQPNEQTIDAEMLLLFLICNLPNELETRSNQQ